ncbi:ribosomal L7Ae/L30e/S12e/Gadd45 family protein [Veillonella sp.]|uniref:L7Ae/L30e/S12e/Gadd45 family ribosomal protein n=1 Tax=Veillonella sp. TaxID=1926307 RepID=UPI0025E9F9B3|nr:ribosomal L7Ae/L30e/S12e/Gadd45 family protein [Veillonella sp.]
MNEDRILNLLGLAQRAGKLSSGDFIVEKAMKKKTPNLVLLAGDCAANNEKKYIQLAELHHIPLRKVGSKETLGAAIGKEVRVVVAVEDDGFAKALLKEIDQ